MEKNVPNFDFAPNPQGGTDSITAKIVHFMHYFPAFVPILGIPPLAGLIGSKN
jgi:hypothetical protein